MLLELWLISRATLDLTGMFTTRDVMSFGETEALRYRFTCFSAWLCRPCHWIDCFGTGQQDTTASLESSKKFEK